MSRVRYGGATVYGSRRVRYGGLLVSGRPAPFIPAALGSNFDDWTKANLTVASDGTFANGNPRFLASATGTGEHTMTKTYSLASGATRTFSMLMLPGTCQTFSVDVLDSVGNFMDYVFGQINGGYIESGGTVTPSFTTISGSLRQLNIVATNPVGSTGLRYFYKLWSATEATSYTAAGETMYLGGPTLT